MSTMLLDGLVTPYIFRQPLAASRWYSLTPNMKAWL